MPDTESSAKPESPVVAAVAQLPITERYVLALSGGRDSMVLLHALVQAGVRLRAVHVDHGLHEESARWAETCRQQCDALGVPFVVCRLVDQPGSNLEAWAREQRYAALQEQLQADEVLLTAHHESDQAETVLLHLLRGASERGLAAMAAVRALGEHRLLRPLLEVPASAIAAYAQRHALQWLDDPSNDDLQLDRNFLRHEILPRLAERFAGAERNLARSAARLGELSALHAPDLKAWVSGEGLSLPRLAAAMPAERNRVLLAWLRRCGLPSPRHQMLDEIWRQFLAAAPDREPLVRWPGGELRRYREVLYAMPPLVPERALDWRVEGRAQKAWPYGGTLRWDLPVPGRVTTPVGGETLRLNGHQRRLGALFQTQAVPPWRRRRTPLLYLGEELVAVGAVWRAERAPAFGWEWNLSAVEKQQ